MRSAERRNRTMMIRKELKEKDELLSNKKDLGIIRGWEIARQGTEKYFF